MSNNIPTSTLHDFKLWLRDLGNKSCGRTTSSLACPLSEYYYKQSGTRFCVGTTGIDGLDDTVYRGQYRGLEEWEDAVRRTVDHEIGVDKDVPANVLLALLEEIA